MKAKWRRELINKASILQHNQISKAVGALVFNAVFGVTVNNLIVYFSSNRWKYMLIFVPLADENISNEANIVIYCFPSLRKF